MPIITSCEIISHATLCRGSVVLSIVTTADVLFMIKPAPCRPELNFDGRTSLPSFVLNSQHERYLENVESSECLLIPF